MGQKAKVFFPSRPLQPNLVCRAGAYPKSAPVWCILLVLCTNIRYMLEKPDMSKHSSLQGPLVSYNENKVL